MRITIITAFLMLLCTVTHAQKLFQDAAGESNIFPGNTPFGWIFFNTSDKSASLGYNHFRRAGYDIPKWNASYLYGGDVKVNVKDGVGNLLAKGDFKPGISVNGNLGITRDTKKGNILNLYLRPGFSYNEYTYISNMNAVPAVQDLNKKTGSLLFNVNYQVNGVGKSYDETTQTWKIDTAKHFNILIGVQSGYKKINNAADLDEVEVRYRQFGNNDTAAYTSKKGKLGTYAQYDAIPLNIDLAFMPRIFQTNVIGFNTYYRTNFGKDNNTHTAGIGVYIADPNKPSNITGGLAWQFNDIGNRLDKEGSLVQRSTVFFYVGYTIGAK